MLTTSRTLHFVRGWIRGPRLEFPPISPGDLVSGKLCIHALLDQSFFLLGQFFALLGQFLLEAGYLLNWGLGRTTRLLPCTTSTVVVAITCIVGRIVAAATATGSIVVREQPTIVVMVMVVTCNEKRAISMRLW
jgi:hypothetical protein